MATLSECMQAVYMYIGTAARDVCVGVCLSYGNQSAGVGTFKHLVALHVYMCNYSHMLAH